jgi:hypothetical protein
MFRDKVKVLMDDFGVKQQVLIELISSNRVSFPNKIKNNSFDSEEQKAILDKYGSLL